MSPVRVAVVAVSPQARASLQALVEAAPALDFAGSAADTAGIADRFAGDVPDVVVIELEPQAGDLPVPEAGRDSAAPALVLLTDEADSEWIHEALGASATALLPRGATPSVPGDPRQAAGGAQGTSPDGIRGSDRNAHPTRA